MSDREYCTPSPTTSPVSPPTPRAPKSPLMTPPLSLASSPISPNPSKTRTTLIPSPTILNHPQTTKRSRSTTHQSPTIPDPKRSKRSQTPPAANQERRPKPTPKPKPKVNTHFHALLTHLSTPLQPLVSVTTGLPHPEFPMTILQYHCLTSDQLDALAEHYHQYYPSVPETYAYPMLIKPWLGLEAVDVEVKKRRFGRFIGFGGCESPIGGGGVDEGEREREELERVEEEWNRALARARREEGERALGGKFGLR